MAKKQEQRSLSYDQAAKRLRLVVGKSDETYAVEEFRDGETGYLLGCRLAKENDTEGEGPYDVELVNGACHCRGNLRWGHCKHVDAVRKLVELRLVGA
jgi:hypothetical protein